MPSPGLSSLYALLLTDLFRSAIDAGYRHESQHIHSLYRACFKDSTSWSAMRFPCLQNASVQLDRVEIEGDGTITPPASSPTPSGVVLPTRSGRSGGCDADELFDASLLDRVSPTERPLSVLWQSMGWKRVCSEVEV